MFDSLDEQIKHDDAVEKSLKERIMEWTVVAVLSVLVFGGLYYAVRMIE